MASLSRILTETLPLPFDWEVRAMRGWGRGEMGDDAPPAGNLGAHAGLTQSSVKALCPPNPFQCPHTESPCQPLPLEPQGTETKLETGLRLSLPTTCLPELEGVCQAFPHLLITLHPPPTKLFSHSFH